MANYYFDLKEKDECLVIITSADSEYDKYCRVVARHFHNNKEYIVLSCRRKARIEIYHEYEFKGDYEKFFTVPLTDEWRMRV